MTKKKNDEVFVHTDPMEKRENLPDFDQSLNCPNCGGRTSEGFGLAGGGYGIYTVCNDCCTIVSKSCEGFEEG